MQIVQISDLHFGHHNEHLMEDLKRRIRSLEPDLILATGDLAHNPLPDRFEEAKKFLTDLVAMCKTPPVDDATRPKLIVIPGNHDFLEGGWGPKWLGKVFGGTVDYYASFGECMTQYFFRPEKVWVFGFDSAQKGRHAGGEVRAEDINLFHKSYDDLKYKHGRVFENSFKIAVVHHHPLPVNWDRDWRQQWLTMLNAGSFLGTVLHRGVDLVLHGHEHLQANARLRSTLGGEHSGEIVVVSLGATLRNVTHPHQNWFNVITISPQGYVEIESYGSQGQFAFADTSERWVLRSGAAIRDSDFTQWKTDEGFWYRHIASITLLNSDGDAQRIIECDLTILKDGTKRSKQHEANIPYTSGNIHKLEVKPSVRSGLAGISIKENAPLDLTKRNHTLSRTIIFGKTLAAGDTAKYQYSWSAIDAFAMDESQFEYKYTDNRTNVEFTHFVIEDPVEELLLVVQFPADFLLSDWPEIRVTKSDPQQGARAWERVGSVEKELTEADALRYTESLRSASLRVTRPQRGLSYGIQWRVPTSAARADSFKRGQIMQVVQLLLQHKAKPSEHESTLLLALLLRMAISTRELLLTFDADGTRKQWNKPLEISLMIFDSAQSKLVTIKAASFVREQDKEQIQREIDYSTVTFAYGDGIAGKAFKTNDYRLTVRPVETRDVHYRRIPGVRDPWVLFSVPIRVPSENTRPYGVINLVSYSSDFPLARLGESGSPVTGKQLTEFREQMEDWIFRELTTEILEKS